MKSLLDRSDDLWHGKTRTTDPQHHPFVTLDQLEEVTEGVAFYKNFSNLAAVTTQEGLVLIDTGSFLPLAHERSFARVRSWSRDRLHTAVYTHGHVDHAYGLPPFLSEGRERGWAYPNIVAHRAVVARMERYILTAGFNAVINTRQFNQKTDWPTDPIYPTTTYDEALELVVGGRRFQLFHARGETDDHTWVFLPAERVLYTGDLFIWSVPNAGNPQKVQRYATDWCRALRQMAALEPRWLLPGHGLPLAGEERVRAALLDTAQYLESLVEQTLELMNQGATLDDILHTVRPPKDLAERPYLQPVYDEPEFVVRNLYRCFGGWYSGTPSELKPAPLQEQGRVIAAMAGGVGRLLEQARSLLEDGNLRLACHVVDWAVAAEPESREAHEARAQVYSRRVAAEPSTMSRGIFRAAARESRREVELQGGARADDGGSGGKG